MFPTEERCRELLVRLRWPSGPECPRCKGKVVELETGRQLFYCKDCNYQFTVTAGAIFNDSHLPLAKWFVVTLLLCESKKGMSANQVKPMLGISYKTAWYLCHLVRASMKKIDRPMPDGTIEMDETYVGGKIKAGKRGRGSENREVVVGTRKRGGELRFFHSSDIKSGTLSQYIKDNISTDVDVVIIDDLSPHPAAMRKAAIEPDRHKTVRDSQGEYVAGAVHTNSVESAFSLLKRGAMDTWPKTSAKHLAAYLDQMEFRFNRGQSDVLFLDTLRRMVTAPVLTFGGLTAEAGRAA